MEDGEMCVREYKEVNKGDVSSVFIHCEQGYLIGDLSPSYAIYNDITCDIDV